MRIISFSPVPMQALWSAPVQALTPWIKRICHTFTQGLASPVAVHRPVATLPLPSVPFNVPASNDALFTQPAQAAELAPGAKSRVSARSTLRIVREADAAIRPDCAGRMVISGRMADVCAELDRLALLASGGTAGA